MVLVLYKMCTNVAKILWQHFVPYVNTPFQGGLAACLREHFYVTCDVKLLIETMLHVTHHVKAAHETYSLTSLLLFYF